MRSVTPTNTHNNAFEDGRALRWPRHLQVSWRDCAERGEVDGHTPPTSIVQAYLQVAEAGARRKLAVCARCGAGELEYFYTSKRDGRTLCAGAFSAGLSRDRPVAPC